MEEGIYMKKTAVICALLLGLAGSAWAQANDDSVEHTHTVSHISTETATQICGEQFSTSFFNEQYEKLALLKRCELSLKTVPLKIWDLDRYEDHNVELPYTKLEEATKKEIKSFLGVEKLGKYNVITISHLYKQNRKLHAINTSLLSAKDQLYALTTVSSDDEVFSAKKDDQSPEIPVIIKRMQDEEAAKLSNLAPAELNEEVRIKIWNEHLKFVRSFKNKS